MADRAKLRDENPTNTEIWTPIHVSMYLFAPVVIETSGVFGKQTLQFLNNLACHVCKVSGDVQSFSYLLQRLAVAV